MYGPWGPQIPQPGWEPRPLQQSLGREPSLSARVLAQRPAGASLNVPLAPQLSAGKLEPLLVAAGGGGRAYLRRQDRGGTQAAAEKLENRSAAPGSSGRGGAAGEVAGAVGEASSHPIPLPAILLLLHRWRGRLDVEGPLSAGRPLLAGGSGGRPGLRRGLGHAWLGCGRRLRGRRRGLHCGWRRRWLPG